MSFYSKKVGKVIEKLIFRALEWKVWRFVSERENFHEKKRHGKNTWSALSKILSTRSTRFWYFTSIIVCVLFGFGHTFFAYSQTEKEFNTYEYHTIKILPGTVKSVGWKHSENILSQELNDDSLFQNFNRGNSATLERVSTDDVNESNEDNSVTPVGEDSQLPVTDVQTDGVLNQDTEPTPSEDVTDQTSGETQSDDYQGSPESEPLPEAPSTPVQEVSIQTLSKSFFIFTNIADALLPFATETFTETFDTPVSTDESTVGEAIQSETSTEENVAPVEMPSENTPEAPSENQDGDVETGAPGENSSEPQTDAENAEQTSEQTPSDASDVTGSVDSENDVEIGDVWCDGCTAHILELGDFSVPTGEEEQITNMQLRVSLGAQKHNDADPARERIKIEYLHYDYWIDGGVIEITDEISNAMNGGYFLFGFPLYSEWDEMRRIKVRLTYESDNEHLADVYVDSVWLEVESIDGNAFNEEEIPREVEDSEYVIPDGYHYNFISKQTEFTHEEMPRFVFDLQKLDEEQGFWKKIGDSIRSFFGFGTDEVTAKEFKMRVMSEEFKGLATLNKQSDGTFALEIPHARSFKPGKHVVVVEVTDGENIFYIEQEFTWGVLAFNTDKSRYLPSEEGYLQMGVLSDLGHTICDASLTLTITSPMGNVIVLDTDKGTINYGEECAGDTYTTSPDYDATYQFADGIGEYEMVLTAVTDNGTYSITENIQVVDAVSFDVVRTGPTRIYPPRQYPVTLTITANEAYVGEIVEEVPINFQVYEHDGQSFRTHDKGDVRQLIWDVTLSEGETIELSYEFDAPDVSPAFYLIGPLTIGTYTEAREWQIASDAPSNATIVQSAIGADVTATSYSATFGSAPTAGNLIIMVAAHADGASAFNAPASYLTQVALSNAGVELDIGMWYALANPATTTYTITKTGGNQTGVVAIYEVSGLNTTNPVNVTATNDQTGSNSRTAYTGATATSTQFGFAFAAVSFADNDFNVPTTASWTSDSANALTQRSWTTYAAGNDFSLGLATANVNIADTQGATLTLTGGGSTEQRNSLVGVFNLRPQVNTVGSIGNQQPQIKINTANNHVGGAFTFTTDNGSTTVTSITVSETGTTDASVDLSSIRLKYEFDSVAPYDCASATYDGTETQYGATSTAFSSANGTSTFTGSVSISTTSAMCAFVVLDVDASATAGHTLELQITNPSTQVITGTGSTSPATAVAISDTTTLTVGYSPSAPVLTETPAFPEMFATTTQPTFGGFVSTDSDGDVIEYEFSIDDDPLFGSPATTTYSSNYPSDAGWASTTFTSGATTTYRIQQALTPGTTYWWRARARDPFNTNQWGGYSPSRSITIGSDISTPEWFETVDEQFASSTTFTNATTSGDSVLIDDLDTAVTMLDGWTTGNTKTVSNGSDRLLIVTIISEDSGTDVNVNTVTYGGQTLTEIYDQQIGTGYSNGMWMGYLTETGIRNASGNAITPTWTGSGTPTPNNGILYTSAVFSGVDQTSPIRGYSPNALTAGTTITPASSVSVLSGDYMVYVSETATGLTHTPPSGYTEGTEQDSGGTGFVAASAYKAISTDGSEFPTATWSASGNRLLMIGAAIKSKPAEAVIMSEAIDFDWVANQNDWGEVSWHTTESSGETSRLRVYYGTSTSCSTLIPDGALAGNSTGFVSTSSPINISSIATSTYNRICLGMTLSEGTGTTSPSLDDWKVSWDLSPLFEQKRYHWFVNTASATPTNTWPPDGEGTELGQNEAITNDRPVSYGDVLRLRMGLEVSSVTATGRSFKLQYAESEICDSSNTWQDVGPIGSTTALWRGYNNAGLSDGATLSATVLTSSDELETYEEENNASAMPNAIISGDQGEWDWVLESGAAAGTSYCFRMVTPDGTPLTTYTQYPNLVTNEAPSILTMPIPFNNEKLASTTAWFEFVGVDAEGNEVDYQIQIDNDANFGSTLIDTDSITNLFDFSNTDTPADKSPFNESETIRFTSPISFSNGTTYWWRVRSMDTGSDEYGAWSTSQSFTVDTGVTISTWFQTTEEQFDTDTLEGTDATASDLVAFASGSTTGTTTSSAIDFDSGRIGNAWGQFSFTETGSANDILYHIEYDNGGSWELVPDVDLSGNAAGFDTSPVNLIDLDTETYNTIRIRANFNAGSPTLSDWTVTWGQRVSVPTHLLLFNNEKTGTTTPSFTFYTTDPQGDALEYEMSWSTDKTFATGSTTVNSSTSPGFVNISDGLDTNPFDSGDTIRYTMQTPLTDAVTYWWRVRAKDPFGGNNFSFWSNPWSFTVASTATTSTWFQTTEEQFETDTLLNLVASTSDSVSTIPAGVTTYTFAGITNPSATHIARYFEVDVDDPTDPPTFDEIDTITTNGTTAGTPNLRTAIAGHAGDVEASNAQYTALSTSNDSRWTTADPGNTDQAIIWSSFLINEDPANITQIEVQVEGYQGGVPPGTDKAWFGIWRPGSTTPYWQNLEALQTTSDNVFNGTITTNISQYFDGNNRIHLMFFNEDDSDPVVVDYIEVKITTGTADTGTLTGTSLDFDDGSGPAWGQFSWNDSEPGFSSLTYQLEYLTLAGTWALIPDGDLPGNSTGFSSSPVNINTLDTGTYNEIRPIANFECILLSCPTLYDWTIKWSPGFTITGTAFEYDGVSSTTAGTVAVAVDGVLQTGKTGSIVSGAWSIENVSFFEDDVITVFVNGANDADEAVAVTVYDGVPDMSGLRLQKRHLTIGSDDLETVTNTHLSLYDYTNDEDIFYDVNGSSDLTMCADVSCGDAGIVVRSGNTYSPGTGADVITHDFRNDGTFISGANTLRVSGSWDNNATGTMTGGTVIFTATATAETIDSTGATVSAFNAVTFGETSGTATWTLASPLDVDGALGISYGTLARDAQPISVAGNLTILVGGAVIGMSTTTFDGTNPSTWTDSTASKQNLGNVVIDGTVKTTLFGSNVKAQSITIGADDTLDASTGNYDITVYANWTNNNTFVARSGEVFMSATTTNKTITAGGDTFYDLTFNGGGGAWSFSEALLSVGGNFTVATGTVTMPTGTTTLTGSWNSVAGTFAHNNATVLFTATAAKTISASGTPFTNNFYNMVFTGSGSWSFLDTYATTSNDIRITQGTVTFPSANLSVGGSFTQSGGTFAHNSGTVSFTSASAETIDVGASSFNSLSFAGSGSWSFLDANITALGSVWITGGTLTLPSGIFSVGGSFGNWTTVTHNSGTVLFNSTDAGETIRLGNSSLYNATLNGTTGGWTVTDSATTTNNFTLTSASSFTLASGQTLAVSGTFTNSVGGASTTWTGSILSLDAGAYSINTKINTGDVYETIRVNVNADIKMWNSSAATYDIDATGSLYSQDHAGNDGDLYIFGAYERTSGNEYWSYATDFDGTSLGTSSARQVDVRFASGASASILGTLFEVVGSTTATTTVGNQGSGAYTVTASVGTTTFTYYDFNDLGATGVTLAGNGHVTSLNDGSFTPATVAGTGLTISSTTIDANQGLQIYRVVFSTTTAISATNVTQTDGAPTSYWWFRQSLGNIDGEYFDNDTGDPGSIRWDDSSLVISISGTVYSDDGSTPMGTPVCDDSTQNVRVVVSGGASYTGSCASADGSYSIGGVVVVGDPVLTVYLNTNGGARGTVVTRTPTANITNLDIYQNRVTTRHEDTAPLTILNMAVYDYDDDQDIFYTAATGTLTVMSDTELHIASSTTFSADGDITIRAHASSTLFDGSLHIDDNATFTGYGASTYTIGGNFMMDDGAIFERASTTVVMNATTTGKALTTTGTQEIHFNELIFNGVAGSWNVNSDIRADQNIYVASGTVSGTGDIAIVNGSFYGNGLVSLGSGTTTLYSSNTLGGTTGWTFGNLVLGNGSIVGTTTIGSNATTTILGKLTISNAHFLNAGGAMWNLAGTGTVFTETGTFVEATSTVRYSGTGATNILSTSYYNLEAKAQGGSPTYIGTGLGITVVNNLTVGGATTTTVTFDTSDPALDVNGNVYIESTGTFVGSASASTTVAGDWDNNGAFTGSGGRITFDGSGTTNIYAGNSAFSNVTINGTGAFTVAEHATTTALFTLTNAGSFTLASGQSLAVGGAFTNNVNGANTVWTGSTLFLYGGGNYTINTTATGDTYEALKVAANTHIRMWNASAGTYDVHSSGSLYSQDHANVNGDLYIFGGYTKASGTDYWSYATDFDGSTLGSPRAAHVYFASSSSATYTGGGLAVIGTAGASTTIANQGSGTYALRIGGISSTTWAYYELANTDAQGLTFSGTPNVVNLSYGRFAVSQIGGSALTVGGTVINQNQAKTFTNNYFGTTTGVSTAYNVTATGTTISSWRFTNHNGDIDGESFDNDPAGNPGYVVWDDSDALITVSGKVYSDEGSTVSTACDGSTDIHLRVAGLTSYTTSCSGGDGSYSISNVAFSPSDSIIVYIDGKSEKAATVSVDPASSIANMDLYENRIIVRHEGASPITVADMSVWDSSDDADIPFTAIDSAPDTLTLPADRKLIVWANKEFEPNGNVTLSGGGGGSAYDGTLELYSGATFDATGSESHTVGGSFITGAGAILDDETSTFTFTTSGSGRTIDTNEYAFYNLTFNGSGSWNVTNTALDVGNDLTITQGTVTLPSGTTTITGSLTTTGGSFNANGGTVFFNSGASETIRAGASVFNALTINGGGSFTLQGGNATATADVLVINGSFTSATGTFAIAGDFVNDGTFTHNGGTLRFTSGTGAVVTASSSDLGSVTFAGSGAHFFTDENLALLGSLRIEAGSVLLASGTMSVGGSFLNTGGSFDHASGTILFNSSDTGESVNPGNSSFHTVSFASASGGWTITGNATTTANFSLVSATNFTLSSSTRLVVQGVFTNLVGGAATTWTGSTLAIHSGTGYTINTKVSGGDTYNNILVGGNTALRAWDSAGTVTMLDSSSSLYSQDHAGVSGALYIFGNYVRTTGADYWSYATDFDGTSLGGSSRQAYVYLAEGASTTLTGGSLNIVGINGFDTTISNQGSGTYGMNIQGGTLHALYYSFANMGAQGLALSGTTTITSLTEGNFTLAVNGGSLITLSSTTLNHNTGLVITGASFATTTSITGYNVNVIGTTPSAWTFTTHTGNLDGEVFDNDGGDDCGSVRWDDSSCLLTQQSAYRWRNDDGGEGVPDTEWYDQNWSKRKRVTVTNADPASYTNATIKLVVTYDTDMQTDFDDLRFTASDGTTVASHFIEKYTASSEATVWVKVPMLATSTDTDVYMYYGNGSVSDGSATSTFTVIDNFEDGNNSEYSGDTAEFTVVGSSAYERTYRLEASDPTNGKTDAGGMYNNSATVSQGETLRFLKYIDTGSGSADEVCTLFGTQNQTQNYAVCLELFGVDRISIAQDVLHRDTSGTVLASTTVTYSTGWYEVEVDWATDDSISVTLSKDGSVVATTSTTDTSYSSGGIGYTLWGYHGGWDMYTSRLLLSTQPTTTFGFEQVSGGASWLTALNTVATGIDISDKARVRFLVENTGLPVTNQNYELEFAPKGVAPSCEAVAYGNFVEVPNVAACGTSDICMESSSQFMDHASTTDLLGGEGIFTYGQMIEDPSNNTGNISIQAGEYTELEYVITPTSNVTDSNYCFRVSNEGTDLDSYTKVAEMSLHFAPNITSLSLNGGADIILVAGVMTTIYATGTVSDLNGYTDIAGATSTIFRSGVGESCSANNNNCYVSGNSLCTFSNCAGDSCDVTCSADIYYHADPTDAGDYGGETWRALLRVEDTGSAIATATAPSVDLMTLRALDVNSSIDYGALEVGSDTNLYNATTTIENIGNDSLDISVEGSDLTDGGSSQIPATYQKFATSSFPYSACTYCSTLSGTPLNYKVDLTKPTSTTPSVTDEIFWGIAIPFGVSGAPHQGTNVFYAIDDF